MTNLTITHEIDREVVVRDGDVELFRYVYIPDNVQLESTRPYFYPIRTRAGLDTGLYRPHDHVWHKGITLSLPVVNNENFWGGPPYVTGEGYVQLPNNGTQGHRRFPELHPSPQRVVIEHDRQVVAGRDVAAGDDGVAPAGGLDGHLDFTAERMHPLPPLRGRVARP